jgi:EAL domain-containing protein (putative c-di-GMP-specific phosphodiesterase class I)
MSEEQTVRMVRPARVLIVDDEAPIRKALARSCIGAGHLVTEAPDAPSALDMVGRERFDVVLTDITMPGMSGIELLRAIRARDLDVPVIIMTGAPSIESAIEAIQLGAMEYVKKPFQLADVVKTLGRASTLGRIARAKRSAIEEASRRNAGPGDQAGRMTTFERALDSMWMAFQPIVQTKDGTLYGHEALMRSREPELPHPGAVLEAAEKLERLDDLGARTRALTAAAVANVPDAGVVFVNLHPRDLFDPLLTSPEAPLTALASRVVLEITERASLGRMADARARIAELRAVGFRIAVDDLGAGYAGLESFAMLEPEIVKLDMSLVRGVDQSPTKRKIIETMAGLCHDLGMLVVAEGVETEAELRAVSESGCDLVQGYLIAKPGPAFPKAVWPKPS